MDDKISEKLDNISIDLKDLIILTNCLVTQNMMTANIMNSMYMKTLWKEGIIKKEEFEKFAEIISEDKLKTPEEAGLIYKGEYRLDCKPMAVFKETYFWLGGEPALGYETGDVVFIDNAIKNGIKCFQAADSVCYHFQAGRKR